MSRTMSKAGPSLCRHKRSGRGYARFNSRQVWFGPYDEVDTHKEFARFKAEWEANGRRLPERAGRSANASRTVADLVADYLEFADRYYRRPDGTPTGHIETIRLAMRVLVDLYGHTPAHEFGPPALRTVRQGLIDTGLTRTGINQRVGIIQRMFTWAHAEADVLPVTVAWSVRSVKPLRAGRSTAREPEPVLPVPMEHVRAILPQVSRQVAAMIQIQLVTGMRPGEVVQMRGGDLDRNGPVHQGDKLWVYRPTRHKNQHRGKRLEVAIPPLLQDLLKPFIKLDSSACLFSPAEAEAERSRRRRATRKTPMTPSQARRRPKEDRTRAPGDSYTVAAYRVAIERACKRAGAPRWHPHQLRHVVCSEVANEHGPMAAMATLSHATLQATQRYTALDGGKALAVVTERARRLLPPAAEDETVAMHG